MNLNEDESVFICTGDYIFYGALGVTNELFVQLYDCDIYTVDSEGSYFPTKLKEKTVAVAKSKIVFMTDDEGEMEDSGFGEDYTGE